MIGVLSRQARDCSWARKIILCIQVNKIARENYILHAVYPKDVAEDLEPPDLEEKSKPIPDEGHRSLDVPTSYRNCICGISCVNL